MSHQHRPDQDIHMLGSDYRPPKEFESGMWYQVGVISKTPGSDGYDVTIQECRMPARFFQVCVQATENSVGQTRPGFTLCTGSGEGELAAQLAQLFSIGMLALSWDDNQVLLGNERA